MQRQRQLPVRWSAQGNLLEQGLISTTGPCIVAVYQCKRVENHYCIDSRAKVMCWKGAGLACSWPRLDSIWFPESSRIPECSPGITPKYHLEWPPNQNNNKPLSIVHLYCVILCFVNHISVELRPCAHKNCTWFIPYKAEVIIFSVCLRNESGLGSGETLRIWHTIKCQKLFDG